MSPRGRSRAFLALVLSGGLLVAALASLLLFRELGASSLAGDETIHASVAREAAESAAAGDGWLPLTFGGELYQQKPPLKILAVAWLFRHFGVGEWTARVLDAGLGVATVLLVYLWGLALPAPGAGAAGRAARGLVAAGLLLGAEQLVFRHGLRNGVQDSALLFLLTLALACYHRWAASDPAGLRRTVAGPGGWLVVSALAVGLATWVKAAAALVAVPGLLLFGLVRLRRDGRRPLLGALFVGGIGTACYLSWIVYMLRITEGGYLAKLHRDLVVRATEGVDPAHLEGPFFYLGSLAEDFGLLLPLLLLPPALLGLFPALASRWLSRARGNTPVARARDTAFLAVNAAALVAIPSLSISKLPWYVYPAYPPLALLLAGGAVTLAVFLSDRLASRPRGGRRLAAASVLAVALLVAGVLGGRLWEMWRIAGQQARIEPTARLAEILDGLEPPPWIVARQGALLSPWHRFYLDPLLDWRYRVPPPFWQPREGCRFLLQDEAWQGIPLHVLREAEPGSSGLFLHDFDRCLPEDEVALEVLPVTDGREGEAGGGS